jgi:hypothetical protein
MDEDVLEPRRRKRLVVERVMRIEALKCMGFVITAGTSPDVLLLSREDDELDAFAFTKEELDAIIRLLSSAKDI